MDKSQLPKMLKKLHFYLLLLSALIGFGGFAQTYPISISTQVSQPSPIYLSRYADATTINSPIKIQLVLNDLTISNRQVKLKIYFQGNGISFSTNDYVVGARPLFLEGGFPLQLTNVDLAPYFEYQNLLGLNPNQYAQPLPEGVYNIYVEVFDFATGKKLSNKTGSTTIIFQNEPPFLNLPLNNASIMQQNIQNIIFSWTPRSINVSNVEYEFSLVEIWDKYTPVQNAFAYSPPLYTTTTRTTTLQYGISEPQLIPGKKYAWRIKAKAIFGAEEIGVFKNNGYTEIFSFDYEMYCTSPLAITTSGVSENQAKISWSGNIDNYDYQVNYREKNANSEWYKVVTPRESIALSNLKPNATYEYTVGASCEVGKYAHSTIKEFTTIARDEIAFEGCGIKPDPKDLANKTPLPELFPNDVVTAGDFPIVVLHSTGSNGKFSGDGYVTLPFLEKFRKLIDAADALGGDKINIGQFSRIRITFDNIGVNTDFKLISGEIVASYDPDWGSMIDGDKLVDGISDFIDDFVELNFFGSNDDIAENKPNPKNNDTIENNPPITPSPTVNSSTPNIPVTTGPPIVNNTSNTTSTNTAPAPNDPTVTETKIPVAEVPKLDFKSISLTAFDHKTKKRIAKENETLYYVKNGEESQTDLQLNINKKLSKDKLNDNVHWFRDESPIDKSDGLLKLTSKDLNKNATIKSVAGFPNESIRTVDVKFVSGTSQELSLFGVDLKSISDKVRGIEKAKEELDKKLHTEFFKFKLDKIEFVGSKKNEEDANSRLYKIVEKGAITGGAKLELAEIKFTIPPLKALSRLGIADIGLFASASIGLKAEGGVERYKFIESSNFKGKEWSLELKPYGCIELGLEAKLLIAKNYVNFLVEGSAKGCIQGQLKYNFTKKDWEKGEVYIAPIVLAANINISAKGPIEFELIKYERSIEITNKIPLTDDK